MKQSYKTTLAVLLAIGVTFVATMHFANGRSAKTLSDTAVKTWIEIESFNDVGRVETFDILAGLVEKGCSKEALEFIKLQQTLLLSGLKNHMDYSEKIKDKVMSRNPKVGERAIENDPQKDIYVHPSC